ncbi:MAG: isoprenylcysteine carboxylmethyltransferase family protein [bacterium]|nr:isoprenylcysteine carboxylmethyltransferase family protein [bacterium]
MNKFQTFIFKFRSFTPIPLLILLLIIAKPTISSFLLGFCLMLLGEFIRLWAVAHAGGATRTREVGAPYLVTTGPYAYIRNPLYFGNMMIYLGVVIIGNSGLEWMLPLTFVYFFIQYSLIIALEEETLITLFGARYEEYRAKVPKLFPYAGYIQPIEHRPCDWKEAFYSERSTFASHVAVLLLLLGKMIFNQRFF